MTKYTPTNKFVGVDGGAVFSQDDTALLFQLSRQDTQLLLQLLPSMHWRTRWEGEWSQDAIDTFVSKLELKLMIPIDPQAPIEGGYAMATLPVGAIFHSASPICAANCLPLWQNFTTDVTTHEDFIEISGQVTMYVLRSDYPDLYEMCPDFQQSVNLGGVPTDCIDLSGFQGRFLMGNNPDNLANDVGDGDITSKSVSPSLRRNGEEIHILTEAEMPDHTHDGNTGQGNTIAYRLVNGAGAGRAGNHATGYSGGFVDYTDQNYPLQDHSHPFVTSHEGGGDDHNNMPPYITTYRFIVAKPADDLFDGVITDENICDYVDDCLSHEPVDNDPQWDGYDPADNIEIDSLDCVYGGLERLMVWLNNELNNYLDIIDEVGDILAIVPVFSIAGALIQFMGVMSSAVTTLVRLGNTQDLRDEIACWLFCRIKARGEPYMLLPDDLIAFRAYAWEVVNENVCEDIPVFSAFCPDVLIDILGDNRRSAYMAWYYMFSMFPYESYIKRFAVGYSDECNDDWEILCDCGNLVEFTLLASDADGFEPDIVFEIGETYRVIASGQYRYSPNANSKRDAQWNTFDNWTTVNAYSAVFGLQINNVKLPEQVYSSTHIYQWDIAGDGDVPNFRLHDDVYGDNSGEITITIIQMT